MRFFFFREAILRFFFCVEGQDFQYDIILRCFFCREAIAGDVRTEATQLRSVRAVAVWRNKWYCCSCQVFETPLGIFDAEGVRRERAYVNVGAAIRSVAFLTRTPVAIAHVAVAF